MSPDQVAALLPVLRPLAVRLAANRVGAQDAEDVAQAAIAVLVERAADVEPAALESFVRTTVWKTAATHRRRHGREVVGPTELAEELEAADPTPEDALISAELSRRVQEALDALVSSGRRILVAVTIDERPLVDVAREERIPESTARARRDAAEGDLREALHRQRVAERRRTGGFASWCVAWIGLMDVRAMRRRALALLGAAAGVAAVVGGEFLQRPAIRPTMDEAPERVVEVDTLRPITPLPAAERGLVREPSVSQGGGGEGRALTHPSRTRHDAGARFLEERLRHPDR